MSSKRERLVGEKYAGWCEGCLDYHPFDSRGSKVRMWARRHVEKTGHVVNVSYTSIRKYRKEE